MLKLLLLPLRGLARLLLALLILFEEWGWEPLRRAMGWLASRLPLRWLERGLARLPPSAALVVLVLPSLLINSKGMVDPKVVRSVMGMRSALAPEIAAEAARLGGAELADKLDQVLSVMAGGLHDLNALQVGAMHFWQTLAIASDNIAYQLAFNTMRRSYHKAWDKLTYVMAREFQDLDNLKAIASAVRHADANAARAAARAHVDLGRQALESVFALM